MHFARATQAAAPCQKRCRLDRRSVRLPTQFHMFALRRSSAVICTASTSDKESTKQDDKVQVPDSAPAGPSQQKTALESSQGENGSSLDDVQRRAAELRASSQQLQPKMPQAQPAKDSLVEGVIEEIGLIKWPGPKQALLNTLLVMTLVSATSALLFAVNSLLAELSQIVY